MKSQSDDVLAPTSENILPGQSLQQLSFLILMMVSCSSSSSSRVVSRCCKEGLSGGHWCLSGRIAVRCPLSPFKSRPSSSPPPSTWPLVLQPSPGIHCPRFGRTHCFPISASISERLRASGHRGRLHAHFPCSSPLAPPRHTVPLRCLLIFLSFPLLRDTQYRTGRWMGM